MLRIDDGKGLYTTAGLIDSVIVELNEIECKGVTNHSHIISCLQKLSSVKEVLIKMESGKEEDADEDHQE